MTLTIILIDSSVQSGSLLIDSSTIDPSVSQEMETLSKEKGVTYMDAPVSGGKYLNVQYTELHPCTAAIPPKYNARRDFKGPFTPIENGSERENFL